jgi:hypothetical protein
MFAYRYNNPIRYSDPTGCVPVFPVEISGGGVPQESEIPDSIWTKTTGFINGQAIFPYSNNRMGWGTYANNGCGVIAVYNAMQLLESPEPLGLIEAEISNSGGLLAVGLLGVEPWAIDCYFTSHGISCTRYSTYQSLSQDVREGSVIVFLVLNDATTLLGGAHYMAALYTDGKYIVYNMYNNLADTKPVASLYQPYPGSGFVCGFIVGG